MLYAISAAGEVAEWIRSWIQDKCRREGYWSKQFEVPKVDRKKTLGCEPVAWAGETCLTEPTRQAHLLKFGVIADIRGQNDDVLTSGIKCFYTVANPTTSG